ncbi:hypothetical protein [Nocardia asiatica]|uniref:hypothetical protein n=1 Tax=Nocardia asiatica TaxID=209252 RepID=UPI002457EFF3|nr:hypothetical protein [Nocardia asiatica]
MTRSAVTTSGMRISSFHRHCPRGIVSGGASESTHHRPSSFGTTKSCPAAFAAFFAPYAAR